MLSGVRKKNKNQRLGKNNIDQFPAVLPLVQKRNDHLSVQSEGVCGENGQIRKEGHDSLLGIMASFSLSVQKDPHDGRVPEKSVTFPSKYALLPRNSLAAAALNEIKLASFPLALDKREGLD